MPKDSPRCIVCEEAELARVDDARPSQMLPVPRTAVAGFPEGRESDGLTRRRLMQAGLAGFAAVYAPKVLGFEEVWQAAAAQAAPSDQNCLVVIYLAGGNDGLNLMLPGPTFGSGAGAGNDYKNYAKLRPTIHRLAPGDPAAGTGGKVGSYALPGSEMALANIMVSGTAADRTGVANRGLDKLWGSGDPADPGATLALLPAVDYRPPNLSHFDSADHWFYGSLDKQPVGWLGNFIDLYGDPVNPLQAVSIDNSLSKMIRTRVNPVCAIPSLSSLGFDVDPGYGSAGGQPGALSQLKLNQDGIQPLASVAAGAGNTQLARTRTSYGVAVDTYNRGRTAPHAPSPAAYPANSYLADQLRLASILLGANLGTRIITIHWGGFDTHSDEVRYQDPQMRELALCLQAFRDDLTLRGVEDRVATMCFSEFGRRMEENDGQGTDHGAGGLMMLSGSHVRGGQAAEFPGCVDGALLDGNLRPATDFRSVYQSVLAEWLGGDPAAVLPDVPGGGFAPLQRAGGGNASLFR